MNNEKLIKIKNLVARIQRAADELKEIDKDIEVDVYIKLPMIEIK